MKLHNTLKSVVLWTFGGALYFLMEVIYKTVAGYAVSISWTMMVLASIICIPLDITNEYLEWEYPYWTQAVCGGIAITAAEFISGIILNIWLRQNVWNYSDQWGNLLGQVCPLWFLIWCVVAGIGIFIFDWLRWILWPGEERRPQYR